MTKLARRAFLKTLCASAVAAAVPLPTGFDKVLDPKIPLLQPVTFEAVDLMVALKEQWAKEVIEAARDKLFYEGSIWGSDHHLATIGSQGE